MNVLFVGEEVRGKKGFIIGQNQKIKKIDITTNKFGIIVIYEKVR